MYKGELISLRNLSLQGLLSPICVTRLVLGPPITGSPSQCKRSAFVQLGLSHPHSKRDQSQLSWMHLLATSGKAFASLNYLYFGLWGMYLPRFLWELPFIANGILTLVSSSECFHEKTCAGPLRELLLATVGRSYWKGGHKRKISSHLRDSLTINKSIRFRTKFLQAHFLHPLASLHRPYSIFRFSEFKSMLQANPSPHL